MIKYNISAKYRQSSNQSSRRKSRKSLSCSGGSAAPVTWYNRGASFKRRSTGVTVKSLEWSIKACYSRHCVRVLTRACTPER